MQDLELYLAKAKTADEGITSFTELIGNVPTPWEKGDIITFPATIKGNAFKTKIGNKKYEYIIVHVKSADGSECHEKFFPPLFRRRARKCDWDTVDGVEVAIPTNDFVSAGGSIVTEIFNKSKRVNDVVLTLLGKSIKISEVYEVESQVFGTNIPELAKVYDFEPEGWTIGDAPVYIPEDKLEDATTDSDAPTDTGTTKEISNMKTVLLGDIYLKELPLIKEFGTDNDDKLKIEAQSEVDCYDDSYEIKKSFDIKPIKKIGQQAALCNNKTLMINKYLNKIIKSVCSIDINQLITDLSTKKQEVNSLKGQLAHLRDVDNSKSTQIVQLNSEINNQRNEFNTLQGLNVELSSMLESKRADISSLQNERNNLSSDIANKLQTINEQNLRNTALQEQLNQTKSALQNSNQEYARLQEYTIQMRNKCSELERNIQGISEEKDTLLNNIAELQSQIAENNSEIEILKEREEKTTASNEDLLRKQTQLLEYSSAIRAEKDTLLEELEKEKHKNEHLIEQYNQKIESLSSEKRAFTNQIDTLQNDIEGYKIKVELLEEKNIQISARRVELEQENTQLQEEIAIIHSERETIQKEIEENEQQNYVKEEVTLTSEEFPGEVLNIESHENSLHIEESKDGNCIIEDNTEIKSIGSNVINTETEDYDPKEDISKNMVYSNEEAIVAPDSVVCHDDIEDKSFDSKEISDSDNLSTPSSSVENNESVNEMFTNSCENELEDESEDYSLPYIPYIYDDSLIPAEKLSIPEVYDVNEGKIINAREFFNQNESELILWRRNLQEEYLMGHARFICPECKQPVKISGHKLARGRVCYFAHFKDSDDCQYKTGTQRTKEEIERLKYSLVQESDRHKRLKSAIETALKGERSMSGKATQL